ncbi:hypothetical protein [Roseovarius confluentis]|uniref:hypothetical protein n=1 Tax=Roseovarius confluentis TaxID=1852027 RepID=UPI003BAD5C61
MIDWFFIGLAVALGGQPGGQEMASAGSAEAPSSSAFEAEDQTPTGKFTTATEIKPIVEATRGNWVAVREYDGQDWLYLTHLLSWRCGMHQMRVGVNGGTLEVWEMPACQTETATPNAITSETVLYRTFPPGSVDSVEIEILYDDLDTAAGAFGRKEVLMP